MGGYVTQSTYVNNKGILIYDSTMEYFLDISVNW